MNLELEGKSVFVAGSSRGIGRAIAEAFVREGARVAVTGRDPEVLVRAVSELSAVGCGESVMGVPGDLNDPRHADEAIAVVEAAWGPLDVLVAGVGSGRGQAGWDLAPDDWLEAFRGNLFGSMALVRRGVASMSGRGRGSIVCIGSIAGREAVSAPVAYAAAKAALGAASASLSRMLGPLGVRLNVVAPGNILFPEGTWEEKLGHDREGVESYIRSEVPLRRFGAPAEVANVVAMLASECCSFVTGACVVVDGGQTRSFM